MTVQTSAPAGRDASETTTLPSGAAYTVTRPPAGILAGPPTVDLPSGVRVKAQRQTIRSLIRRGLVPDDVAEQLMVAGAVLSGATIAGLQHAAAAAALRSVWDPDAQEWRPLTVTPEDLDEPATHVPVGGLVTGLALPAAATVHVRLHDQVEITALETEAVTTTAGTAPQLPATVTAVYNDGSKDNVGTTVTWEPVDPADYAQPVTFTVRGAIAGTSLAAEATVTVSS